MAKAFGKSWYRIEAKNRRFRHKCATIVPRFPLTKPVDKLRTKASACYRWIDNGTHGWKRYQWLRFSYNLSQTWRLLHRLTTRAGKSTSQQCDPRASSSQKPSQPTFTISKNQITKSNAIGLTAENGFAPNSRTFKHLHKPKLTKYCIGLFAFASCTTVPDCPEPVYQCPEVAVDYSNVALEDAEARLTQCADKNQELKEQIRGLKNNKVKKQQRRKK